MTEHLKCPHYKSCPLYNLDYQVCNQTSGMYMGKAARCLAFYERYKSKLVKKEDAK